jgi:hypothetical protein
VRVVFVAVAFVLPSLPLACAAVPDLSFGNDAASGSAPATGDGGGDGGGAIPSDAAVTDGSATDAAPEGAAPDAPGTCPASPPPGATLCCGVIPCVGDAKKCAAACGNCGDCNQGQMCCLDHNGNLAGCFGSSNCK